ncbi:MAG: hypothetical protein JWM93_245 [Frankiales bacterium]|nr:hypothetical protein [Frankiales bacterium]
MLRRRMVGGLAVAAVAAGLPLAQHPGTVAPSTVAAVATAAVPAPAVTSSDVRAFAGALPGTADAKVAAKAPPAPQADPARTLAEAVVTARTAAARASRDLKRIHVAAVRAAAQKKAAAAATRKAAAAAKRKAAEQARRTRGQVAVEWARQMLGRPYRWGAVGPSTFDCSGLTSYVWRKAGISLSHSSRAQRWEGRNVKRSELRAGDLVFFGRWSIHHVGIYIGGGMMISAPQTGDHVRIQSMDRSDYVGAVRPG